MTAYSFQSLCHSRPILTSTILPAVRSEAIYCSFMYLTAFERKSSWKTRCKEQDKSLPSVLRGLTLLKVPPKFRHLMGVCRSVGSLWNCKVEGSHDPTGALLPRIESRNAAVCPIGLHYVVVSIGLPAHSNGTSRSDRIVSPRPSCSRHGCTTI